MADLILRQGTYYYDSQFSKAEQDLVQKNPREALHVLYLASLAHAFMVKHFHHSGQEDASDAYRHFVWAGMLTLDFGKDKALEYLNAHEDLAKTDDSTKMDISNNNQGVGFVEKKLQGREEVTRSKIEKAGIEKIHLKELNCGEKGCS